MRSEKIASIMQQNFKKHRKIYHLLQIKDIIIVALHPFHVTSKITDV